MQREEALQREIFKLMAMSDERVEARFGFLLRAFAHGTPPHGGFAMGVDRLLALMAGASSIRDVIAFPKTQKASDLLVDAPSPIDTQQLKELGIAISGGSAHATQGKTAQ